MKKMVLSGIYGSLGVSLAALLAGYGSAGYWQALPVLLLLIYGWVRGIRMSGFWETTWAMISFQAAAGVGMVLGLSVRLMMIAGAGALVCWDLVLFNRHAEGESDQEVFTSLDRRYLVSLGSAVGGGFLLAWFSSFIQLELPFIAAAGLVLLAVGGLVFGMKQAG